MWPLLYSPQKIILYLNLDWNLAKYIFLTTEVVIRHLRNVVISHTNWIPYHELADSAIIYYSSTHSLRITNNTHTSQQSPQSVWTRTYSAQHALAVTDIDQKISDTHTNSDKHMYLRKTGTLDLKIIDTTVDSDYNHRVQTYYASISLSRHSSTTWRTSLIYAWVAKI